MAHLCNVPPWSYGSVLRWLSHWDEGHLEFLNNTPDTQDDRDSGTKRRKHKTKDRRVAAFRALSAFMGESNKGVPQLVRQQGIFANGEQQPDCEHPACAGLIAVHALLVRGPFLAFLIRLPTRMGQMDDVFARDVPDSLYDLACAWAQLSEELVRCAPMAGPPADDADEVLEPIPVGITWLLPAERRSALLDGICEALTPDARRRLWSLATAVNERTARAAGGWPASAQPAPSGRPPGSSSGTPGSSSPASRGVHIGSDSTRSATPSPARTLGGSSSATTTSPRGRQRNAGGHRGRRSSAGEKRPLDSDSPPTSKRAKPVSLRPPSGVCLILRWSLSSTPLMVS